jgi:hypothetical protein
VTAGAELAGAAAAWVGRAVWLFASAVAGRLFGDGALCAVVGVLAALKGAEAEFAAAGLTEALGGGEMMVSPPLSLAALLGERERVRFACVARTLSMAPFFTSCGMCLTAPHAHIVNQSA